MDVSESSTPGFDWGPGAVRRAGEAWCSLGLCQNAYLGSTVRVAGRSEADLRVVFPLILRSWLRGRKLKMPPCR